MKGRLINMIQTIFMSFGMQLIKKKQGTKYRHLLNVKRYKEVAVQLLGNTFKVADGMSFYYSYHEIFTEEIYKFNASTDAPVIVDCGSNYGTSIVYFKHLYPKAKITGFEPDPKIYKLLKANIAAQNLQDVEVLNCGVWKEEAEIAFEAEGADGGKISTDTSGNNVIKVKTRLLSDFLKDRKVDFLKIDIEGAEIDVLNEAQNHLGNVEHLFIEYHSFKGKPQRLNEIFNILEENNFRYYMYTQFGSTTPFVEEKLQLGMDLQLNLFAIKKS